MNPYPQRAGNAFGIRPGSGQAAADATKNATNSQQLDPGGNFTNTNIDPSGTSPQAATPNTVLVTPQNAGTYGFDRIGSTINTDTGGIVNPFSGPADGQGGNRAARNAIVQGRAAAANTPIARGYSDIMSDPANVQWNQRMLSDPLFARDQMSSQWATQGKGDSVPGGPVTGTGPMGTSTVPPPTTPYGPNTTGIGSVANPATPSTTSTGSPTGSGLAFIAPGILANGQAVNTGAAGSSGGSSSGSQMSTPNVETQGSNSQPPPTVTMPTNSAYQMPTVQAAQTPRNNVLNAMMRRFDPRGW